MPSHPNPSVPPHLVPVDDLELYARALAIADKPKRTPWHQLLLNGLYWAFVLGFAGWIISMAVDRDPPIKFKSREIFNIGKKVAQGEQVLIRAERTRKRICPLVKRHSIIDGMGRREEFEPEVYDAYGPITEVGKPDIDITGPRLFLDAAPGRGRVITTHSWPCNALQRALNWPIVEVQVLEFEIIPRRSE